jgi:hypothetical protein
VSVTLTYDTTLARVAITATALAAADVALIERSTDQVTWTTVRGGEAWPVAAGVFAVTLYDYEFGPGVPNYYRVSGVETGAVTFVAAGASATGNNASVTPALPAGLVVGDAMIILASIRNSGTGTVNTPTGWTLITSSGNVALLGRRYVAGDVAPLVTFAGGVANADTIARMAAFRRADITPAVVNSALNGSAQNIAYPGLTMTEDGCAVLVCGWKADDWTSVATLAGMTEIAETSTITGDDAAQVWDYVIQTTAASIVAGAFVVTGGAAAISRALLTALPHAPWLNQQTATITPALDDVWLVSIARPFLNQAVNVVQNPPVAVTRPARAGVFDIVGRSLPVAVNDVRSSRRWTLLVRAFTAGAADNLDPLLASGDVVLIQVPADCAASIPHGYVAIGDATVDYHPLRPSNRRYALPCTEVAPPGADVVGAAGTWTTVINTYATWSTELAARSSWADLLTLVGSPSEVIVP